MSLVDDTALIMGVTGQDGILLSRFLLDRGYEVWGFARPASARLETLRAIAPEVAVLHGDIRDQAAVAVAIEQAQPTELYNLAAFSSVGRSWDETHLVMETNAVAVVGLLDALRDYRDATGRDVRFYQASSSEMFGAPEDVPQNENVAFRPRSPYGVSKSAAHYLTVNYRDSYNLFACSGILYNHESWLREPHFVTRKISLGAAQIALGIAEFLTLGTIDVSRDWGFAPEYVEAMWLMLQQPKPDDYVIATGTSHSLQDFLTCAFEAAGIGPWEPYVVHDDDLERPAEVASLVGDASKARERLRWVPRVGFEQIVEHMVEADLAALRGA